LLLIESLATPARAQAPLVVDPKELPRFPAVETKDAAATFQVRPGFHVELAAGEPLVASPIAVCFDENGRMFVLEMRDYSEDREVTPHLGRVRMLEDTNGDGRYDKATIFADDLPWPTALIWANGGLFVLATPDLYRFEDHDGDGRAEKREIIFTGFQSEAKALNVQGLPNSLQWGPDNQIHLQVPTSGASRIRRPGEKDAPAVTGDFFFDPRTYKWGMEAGGGQYGMSYDNEGRRYTCNNSDHLRTYIYDSRLTENLTGLPSPLVSIAADGPAAEVFRISPDEPWRVIRTRWRVSGRVKGIVEGGGRVSGYFTGATGVTIYRGDAFPPEYLGDAFIGDAGGNLVHHKRLRADGVSLIGERPADEKNIEFAASRDTWFRPVDFANAPDGTLYIVDMYREVIEHPHSIPEEIKKLIDLTSGRDRGRIWRLAPDGFKPKPPPRLGSATTEELIKTLGHPNGWHRDTATRLLWERQDPNALALLQQTLRSSPSSLARLHALRVLAHEGGFGAVDHRGQIEIGDLLAALEDKDPAVLELAVSILINMAPTYSKTNALWVQMRLIARAAAPRVRLQLALAFAQASDPEAQIGLHELVRLDPGDRLISAAALGSRLIRYDARKLLPGTKPAASAIPGLGLAEPETPPTPAWTSFILRLAQAVGADPAAEMDGSRAALVEYATERIPQLPLLAAVAEGMASRGKQLASLFSPESAAKVDASVRTTLANAGATVPERIAAARLLTPQAHPADLALLTDLLKASNPPELQRAALDQLNPRPPEDALPLTQLLLAGWKGFAPAFRNEVLRFMVARPARAQALLQEIKAGHIAAADISTADAAQLQQSKDATVAALAKELLPKPSTATREEVIKQFEPALVLAGDKAKGKEVYTQRCATCHRFKGEGNAFGPDLESVVTGGKEKILTHFIDPNREVAPQFAAYTVELKDGATLAGIVASETPNQVILREPLGKETTLAREKIARLQTTGRSPMPEGLEAGLSSADVAGLLEFLTGR
jgi:putative membrane-bound dehydrogenase-like protein